MRGSQLIGLSLIMRHRGQIALDARIAVSGELFDRGMQRVHGPQHNRHLLGGVEFINKSGVRKPQGDFTGLAACTSVAFGRAIAAWDFATHTADNLDLRDVVTTAPEGASHLCVCC
jgi:hypothetical protein